MLYGLGLPDDLRQTVCGGNAPPVASGLLPIGWSSAVDFTDTAGRRAGLHRERQ
jgi:hypothetical protein